MNYTPKAFAFVLNLKKNISIVKKQLIDFIQNIESDDKIYVQNKFEIVFEKRGQAIASLNFYRYDPNYLLHLKMRDALAAISFSCEDHEKIVYIISDNFDFDDYQFQKVVNLCEKLECKLVFISNKECNYENVKCVVLENFENLKLILEE